MHYKNILVIAMKREEKAFEFYNDATRESKDKDHARMFKALAQEESKHKLGLEKLYDDFMAKQGE
ncbi:MAG: ferritin family protein [Desulfobacterales bacterium]|nr:ferritin family protein [Desulfobacterales bacterium]